MIQAAAHRISGVLADAFASARNRHRIPAILHQRRIERRIVQRLAHPLLRRLLIQNLAHGLQTGRILGEVNLEKKRRRRRYRPKRCPPPVRARCFAAPRGLPRPNRTLRVLRAGCVLLAGAGFLPQVRRKGSMRSRKPQRRVGAHRFAAARALPSLPQTPRSQNPQRRVGARRFAAPRALPSLPQTPRRARVTGAPVPQATCSHLAFARVASSSLPYHGWGTFTGFNRKSLRPRTPGWLAPKTGSAIVPSRPRRKESMPSPPRPPAPGRSRAPLAVAHPLSRHLVS